MLELSIRTPGVIIKCFNKRTGDLSLKCSPCKHKNLSSDPQCDYENLGAVVQVCNPAAGKAETGGSLELPGQPVLACESKFSERR